MHAVDALDRVADELAGPGVELFPVIPLEQLHAARNGAQRLLQVVGGDVGETLQLGVGLTELDDRLPEGGLCLFALGDVAEYAASGGHHSVYHLRI